MTTLQWLASLVLAATIVPALLAESQCPGNVASVPFRSVNGHLAVLAISINHSGPYNFLLDTGTQITMIDPSVAASLHLKTQGRAVVAGAGSGRSATYAYLDLVEAGSHFVEKQEVLVYDLHSFPTDLHLQGILGEDFLEHFDLLIDNGHRFLCLDDSAAMRAELKGLHIPLVAAAEADQAGALAAFLLILVRLSDGLRPVRLLIDSGAEESVLFNTSGYMVLRPSHVAPVGYRGVDGMQTNLSALPPQEVRIGSLKLPGVPFFSLARTDKDSSVREFDGVLSTGSFRRVFIDHADRFAILEPR
jgi:hypothetical protein